MISLGSRPRSLAAPLVPALAAIALSLLPAAAVASVSSEEREGAQILQRFDGGGRNCSALSSTDFERIGEYVMGRMAGSTSAHEAMNETMARMMGERAEEQMHVALGQRFTGCGAGRMPAAYGSMMGAMGMMGGGTGGPGGTGGTMGGGTSGTSGMIGGVAQSSDDGWGAGPTVMAILMGLLLILAIAALLIWRPGRPRPEGSPLEALRARYARGEIDTDEYERRRSALGGVA